jgi:SulP family sulfate permease
MENLAADLGNAGVILNLAEMKGPVMDRLSRINLVDHLGKTYLSTHDAFPNLTCA